MYAYVTEACAKMWKISVPFCLILADINPMDAHTSPTFDAVGDGKPMVTGDPGQLSKRIKIKIDVKFKF